MGEAKETLKNTATGWFSLEVLLFLKTRGKHTQRSWKVAWISPLSSPFLFLFSFLEGAQEEEDCGKHYLRFDLSPQEM